jgi:hypothetical protein
MTKGLHYELLRIQFTTNLLNLHRLPPTKPFLLSLEPRDSLPISIGKLLILVQLTGATLLSHRQLIVYLEM